MTLDEAIRINAVLKKAPILKDNSKIISALSLNIEALKRCKALAQNSSLWKAKPLPGETKI